MNRSFLEKEILLPYQTFAARKEKEEQQQQQPKQHTTSYGEFKRSQKKCTNKQNMNHHSDQQTVRTNFDLSVLKIQRPFRVCSLSLSVPFSISFPRSLSLLSSCSLRKEWLGGSLAEIKIKLSFDLWAGTGIPLVHHISDAHVLFDVHIRRLNLCFAAAFPLDHNEFRMKHLLYSV